MADGFNQARAVRTTEVIQQFRILQHQIAQINASPGQQNEQGEGVRLLRQCSIESQAIMRAPFAATSAPPGGDPEIEKTQLKQVMLDAASRRFMAQKVYLKATAAMRWINSRKAILQDAEPNASNSPALMVVDSTLRVELATLNDSKILRDLLMTDQRQGKWTQEDPDLASIQRFIMQQQSRSS